MASGNYHSLRKCYFSQSTRCSVGKDGLKKVLGLQVFQTHKPYTVNRPPSLLALDGYAAVLLTHMMLMFTFIVDCRREVSL